MTSLWTTSFSRRVSGEVEVENVTSGQFLQRSNVGPVDKYTRINKKKELEDQRLTPVEKDKSFPHGQTTNLPLRRSAQRTQEKGRTDDRQGTGRRLEFVQ